MKKNNLYKNSFYHTLNSDFIHWLYFLTIFKKQVEILFFFFSFLVILLDSKAQQTELEWISSPPNGVCTPGENYVPKDKQVFYLRNGKTCCKLAPPHISLSNHAKCLQLFHFQNGRKYTSCYSAQMYKLIKGKKILVIHLNVVSSFMFCSVILRAVSESSVYLQHSILKSLFLSSFRNRFTSVWKLSKNMFFIFCIMGDHKFVYNVFFVIEQHRLKCSEIKTFILQMCLK